jgi:branched-chain amino acid transport system permease protein
MQILCNGLISGLTVGLLAMAFNVVYLPTRVFWLALAAVYASVPFIAWQILQWNSSWALAGSVAIAFGVLLSIACEALNHSPLERKRASSGVHFVSSLGIYIVAVEAIALGWGNETKVLHDGLDTIVKVSAITLTHGQLLAAVVSLALLAIFYTWLRWSKWGLQLRALADNPIQLALHGYDTRYLRLLAFGLAGFLASVCALLVAYDIRFDPHVGLTALLLAIVAVIVGGRSTWVGPVLGALVLGVLRAQVVWFFSAKWQDAVTFALLALFLFLRPQGLLGRKTRLEAA